MQRTDDQSPWAQAPLSPVEQLRRCISWQETLKCRQAGSIDGVPLVEVERQIAEDVPQRVEDIIANINVDPAQLSLWTSRISSVISQNKGI